MITLVCTNKQCQVLQHCRWCAAQNSIPSDNSQIKIVNKMMVMHGHSCAKLIMDCYEPGSYLGVQAVKHAAVALLVLFSLFFYFSLIFLHTTKRWAGEFQIQIPPTTQEHKKDSHLSRESPGKSEHSFMILIY